MFRYLLLYFFLYYIKASSHIATDRSFNTLLICKSLAKYDLVSVFCALKLFMFLDESSKNVFIVVLQKYVVSVYIYMFEYQATVSSFITKSYASFSSAKPYFYITLIIKTFFNSRN